ncbi:hypothetical protein B296_00035399 [Ensete ventricosum]|uniref:Uncharacterized protein n=1 Tax=Ensete ventricosum TaxID=4639 RepID=A0A426Y6F9_ENSVE|nr:hypothetical protein B296_00035399 [Ensete ventricosum]
MRLGVRREFARRFAEGIGKLARNTLGDRRRKTVRLTAGDSEGCGIAGIRRSVVDAGVPQEGLGSVRRPLEGIKSETNLSVEARSSAEEGIHPTPPDDD